MAIAKKQADNILDDQVDATEKDAAVNVAVEPSNDNTVTLDHNLVGVDASQQDQTIVPMDLSLSELYALIPKMERQAEKEQNFPLAAEFSIILSALGGLINSARGLSQSALAFISANKE